MLARSLFASLFFIVAVKSTHADMLKRERLTLSGFNDPPPHCHGPDCAFSRTLWFELHVRVTVVCTGMLGNLKYRHERGVGVCTGRFVCDLVGSLQATKFSSRVNKPASVPFVLSYWNLCFDLISTQVASIKHRKRKQHSWRWLISVITVTPDQTDHQRTIDWPSANTCKVLQQKRFVGDCRCTFPFAKEKCHLCSLVFLLTLEASGNSPATGCSVTFPLTIQLEFSHQQFVTNQHGSHHNLKTAIFHWK